MSQNRDVDLFERLPSELFRPLTSVRKQLNWRILVRLYQTLFEEEYLESDYGHDRGLVLDCIDAVLNQHGTLWCSEDDEAAENVASDVRARVNLAYYALRNSGWLDEDTRGLRKYVTMRPAVSQCLAALIELSEGRPLVVTGALKNMRAALMEISRDPSGQADRLVELTKDAGRFARHVNSVRGAIRDLYDAIQGNIPAREIVRTFFDEFLREIFIRDYASLKTTDNPLAVRSELLRVISHLRYDPNKQAVLQNGYQDLFPSLRFEEAVLRLEQDLSKLEHVFLNIDRQLEAVDQMKARYERRVDTVIDYATRSSHRLGKKLKQLILDLSRIDEGISVRVPMIGIESFSEARFPPERKPRVVPAPTQVKRRAVSDEARERSARERAAREAIRIDAAILQKYLDTQFGKRRTQELKNFTVNSVQDYFCVLHILRAARLPGGGPQRLKQALSRFHLKPTDDRFENSYFAMRNIIITRRE